MRTSPALVLIPVFAALPVAAQAPRIPAEPLDVPTRSLAAEAQAPLQEAVQAALEGRVAPGAVKPGDPELTLALAQVANSTAQPLARRVRALELLGAIGDVTAADRLEGVLEDAQLQPELRAAAAVALARHRGVAIFTTLEALLAEPAEALRVGAARGLATLGTAEARAAIERRLASEPVREVREAMQHTLSRFNP